MSVRHPFVDRPVTDADLATAAAAAAAADWGLGTPAPLRRGMNALYATDGAVLRVGHATAAPRLAHELAEVMRGRGVLTVEPLAGAAGTYSTLAVTAWRRLVPIDAPIDWPSVGRSVRRVHSIERAEVPEGYPVPDPAVFPWWDFDAMLADVEGEVDAAARAGLTSAVRRHRGWQERVQERPVLCHGDVHPGNVVMTADGAVLLDWDLLCHADPAWDHAMLTTYAERWGGGPGVYPAFASGYGVSLADDPLALALGELRNVAATLMRVRAGRSDPGAAEEADRRLRFWRGDPAAPTWRAQ